MVHVAGPPNAQGSMSDMAKKKMTRRQQLLDKLAVLTDEVGRERVLMYLRKPARGKPSLDPSGESATFTFRLTVKQLERLRKIAARQGTTPSAFVREAVEKVFDQS